MLALILGVVSCRLDEGKEEWKPEHDIENTITFYDSYYADDGVEVEWKEVWVGDCRWIIFYSHETISTQHAMDCHNPCHYIDPDIGK